jgi:hypothetical protein
MTRLYSAIGAPFVVVALLGAMRVGFWEAVRAIMGGGR